MTAEPSLYVAIEDLSDTQKLLLSKIVSAFKAGVEVNINPDSNLCNKKEFSDYFANLFSIYHSITEHKFEKKSFEFAFKYASLASGVEAEITKNSSHQGEDLRFGNERISLKTEGEKSGNTYKISKFSEARFIANYKTEVEENEIKSLSDKKEIGKKLAELESKKEELLLPKLVNEFKETLRHHLNSYDRIIALKAQVNEVDGEVKSFRYRLLEIPIAMLENAMELESKDFKPLRGNGGTSASVMKDGKKIFGITLDGSVEKISITGIKISECITHAEFLVPVSV